MRRTNYMERDSLIMEIKTNIELFESFMPLIEREMKIPPKIDDIIIEIDFENDLSFLLLDSEMTVHQMSYIIRDIYEKGTIYTRETKNRIKIEELKGYLDSYIIHSLTNDLVNYIIKTKGIEVTIDRSNREGYY